MMSNVKLGIRVRPFTERELKSDNGKVPVINIVDGSTVTITNVKVNTSGAGDSRERVRRYTADYTFDSSCSASDQQYASQEKIFSCIGSEVVSSFSEGVSACVLAYGQSATGKTYTMMGTPSDPGLVPRICRQLADRASEITVSFLEIYNERVHDLLASEEVVTQCSSLPRRRGNARKDLRVREHPTRGTYVQNLRRVVVKDIESLLALVNEGASRRRTAATRRNSSSSRSHAILELAAASATVHLADLAGSEKASWEGCGGGRQKEGANINKSLVALSNVISALVTAGAGRGRFVPYRDSALTWLLKDCFTGGARTFIIATLSPSALCYGESASTLRWAARAKHLPTPRTLGQLQLTTRSALQSQLSRLIAELCRHHIRYIPETGKIVYEENHWDTEQNKYFGNNDNLKVDAAEETNNDTTDIIMNPPTKSEFYTPESTPSSIASGSSEMINVDGKDVNIKQEVNKEMDKLFGPSLERTKSGSDLKLVAPHRNKKPQYRSQEVLSTNQTIGSNINLLQHSIAELQAAQESIDFEQNSSKIDIEAKRTTKADATNKIHVPFIYDDEQRAEIVASVTERLYSKLKRKEEAAVSKIESVVDRRIMEPLSELRICTNARQRLMALSKKALRNKKKIGIPAHTQTKKQVIRMKDQAVDVQTDLEPYYIKEKDCYVPHQDIGTETASITPRCKEVGVGPVCGSIRQKETSTETEHKRVQYKTVFSMTDDMVKSERCTQTSVPIVAPPRRKRRNPTGTCVKSTQKHKNNTEETSKELVFAETPVVNINISSYVSDSESQLTDESTDCCESSALLAGGMPPDLITNHKNHENTNGDIFNDIEKHNTLCSSAVVKPCCEHILDDFPPETETNLPKVTVNENFDSIKKSMENLILGRNQEMYPYNIVLSPPVEKENYKRSVKFKEFSSDCSSKISTPASETSWQWKNVSYEKHSPEKVRARNVCDKINAMSSDSDELHKHNNCCNATNPNYLYKPVYCRPTTTKSRYSSAKTKIYREFLGLDKEDLDNEIRKSDYSYDSDPKEDFRRKKQYFEKHFDKEHFAPKNSYNDIQRNLLSSCDRLERCVDKYDRYLINSNQYYCSSRDSDSSAAASPKEYLQRLVQLRRDTVKEAKVSSNRTGSKIY